MYLFRKLKTGKMLLSMLCMAGMLGSATPAAAQFVLPKKKINTAEPLAPRERWSFRTNTLGWLLMTPNASLEYSLSADPYNKFTLVANGRLSVNSTPDVLSYMNYKMAGGRLELRKYWHTRGRDRQNKYANPLDQAFSAERYDARTWRGYFFGLYGGYDDVNLKLNHEGYRGGMTQVGLSYGMVRPLYNYKQSVLDIEFSVNAGAAYLSGNKYVLDKPNNQYVDIKEKKGWVPMISDVSISLVYRYGASIRNRNRYNQAKALAREEARLQRQRQLENARDERKAAREAKQAEAAERKAAAQAAKEASASKLADEAAKSAEQVLTAKQLKKQAKAQAKAEKKAAAAAAKAAKKAAKNN